MSIFMAHQGSGDDGQLWYDTFDGETWAGDQQVPDTGMSESPSAVFYGEQLYLFHQGSGEDGQLWYNTFDGETWLGERQVPNTGMSAGPSAVLG